MLGLIVGEHFVPSRRVADAGDSALADLDKVRSEATTSAVGLVMFFCHTCWSRHGKASFVIASRLFVSCLRELLPIRVLADFWEDACIVSVTDLQLCTRDVLIGSSCCAHVRNLLVDIVWVDGREHDQLARALIDLYGILQDCPTLAAHVGSIMCSAGKSISQKVALAAYPADMLKDDAPLRGKKRALRVDEDLRIAVMGAVRDGRASAPSSMVRALDIMPPKSVASFDSVELNGYMAEGWLLGRLGGDISVSPDASRVGNPAKDILVMPCYLHGPSASFILPPQEPVCFLCVGRVTTNM